MRIAWGSFCAIIEWTMRLRCGGTSFAERWRWLPLKKVEECLKNRKVFTGRELKIRFSYHLTDREM